MELLPGELKMEQKYKLLSGAIAPRPIALVSTLSEGGVRNVAPFSYVSIASHDPMTLSVCITGAKPGGREKDTMRNIRREGEFVACMVTESMAERMAATAAPLESWESEFEVAGLTPLAARCVKAARVGESPVCFECGLVEIVRVGNSNLVLGQVVAVHVRDGLMDEAFRMDFDQLAAIGRMAGKVYTLTRERIEIEERGYFPYGGKK